MSSLTRRLKAALATLTLAFLPLGSALAVPVFAITGPAEVQTGSTIVMTLAATDVQDLYAFQFDVLFDPAVFNVTGVNEGPFMASGGTTFFDAGTSNNALGRVSGVLATLIGSGPGVSGSGVLATLSFLATGPASSSGAFSLGTATVLDSTLADVAIVTLAQSVSVTAVPEPATWALMCAGIGLIGELGRRRRGKRMVC